MGMELLLYFPFRIGAHVDQGVVGQSSPKEILGAPFWHPSLL